MQVPNLIISLSILLLGLLGCSSKQGSNWLDEQTEKQILHKGNGTEPKDLDPHTVTGVPEHFIIDALFEGLVMPEPKTLAPVPGVAKSWLVSKDGKTYTFQFRKDAKWTNGDPVTAHDFVYSWKRQLSPGLASEYSYMLYPVKNAEAFNKGKIKDFSKVGVNAKDDYTLVVTLNHSTPYFLHLLQHYSTWPVHKATVEKFGKMDERGTKWTRPKNIVTNGAFKLKTWELNQKIVVEKNPLYWDAKTVRLNQIVFHPIESEQTEERNFRSGKLHITNNVGIPKIATYQKNNPELIRISPYLGTYYYRINVTKPPMDNPKVRRAISMAINREQIVKRVTKGGEIAAFSFVPPNTSGYTSKHKIEFNVEKARKLLAEAGYPNGKGLPKIEILYNTNEGHKIIAVAIQQMLKKNLGIEIGIYNQDWKVYLENQKNLNYQVSRAGWIGDYPDPNTFMDMFVTEGGNNQTGWSNKTYDSLIQQAAATADQEKRYEIFQQAEKILLEESPLIPIYTYTKKTLISPHVRGWYNNILDWHPYKHVWLEKTKPVKLGQN